MIANRLRNLQAVDSAPPPRLITIHFPLRNIGQALLHQVAQHHFHHLVLSATRGGRP